MLIRLSLLVVSLLLFGLVLSPHSELADAQDTLDIELAARMLSAVNGARIAEGLAPYAMNPLLTASAQTHSEYQRDTGQITHTGPDEARPYDRALAAGYPASRVNENIYAGIGGPEKAVEWWLTADEPHRHNVLHPTLREVGVGAATNAQGTTYYTLDISAQPNVLPAFINGDAPITRSETVILTLTNEEVFYGAGQIGYATQVMISNSPDYSGALTQPWARFISWTLDTQRTGRKTVYIRYMDASGRTTDAQDTITYNPRSSATLPTAVTVHPLAGTPSLEITLEASPSLTATAPPSATNTASLFVTAFSTQASPGPVTEIMATASPPPTALAAVPAQDTTTSVPLQPSGERPRSISHYLAPGIIIAGVGAALVGGMSVLWKWFAAYRGRRDGNH